LIERGTGGQVVERIGEFLVGDFEGNGVLLLNDGESEWDLYRGWFGVEYQPGFVKPFQE
jgi:hypothetical protein